LKLIFPEFFVINFKENNKDQTINFIKNFKIQNFGKELSAYLVRVITMNEESEKL